MPSDGGEEVIAPRVPLVLAKPTQAEQEEHYATRRVSPHVSVLEGEPLEVGVDCA